MKRLPLSLNIAPASKAALLARAEREGHRYPAVLAATLLERALLEAGGGESSADTGVVADVAKDLAACASKLRARGAVPADRVESLASALDELAGRLGGAVGAVEDEHEAALSPASSAALQAGLESARSTPPVYLGSFARHAGENGEDDDARGGAR